MQTYVLDDVFRKDFAVSDPATGGAVDADNPPDVEVYEDGGTAAMRNLVAALRDAGTVGQYTVTDTLSAANGYESGKTYNVYALADVGGVIGKSVIATFRIQRVITYFA